jgi:vancomycin resistance protein YoaR
MTETKRRSPNLLALFKAGKGGKPGNRRTPSLLRGMALFLLSACVAAAGFAGFVVQSSQGKIIDGVLIGPVAAGNMTAEQAADEVRDRVGGLTLTLRGQGAQVTVPVAGGDGASALADYDIDTAVRRAYEIGRERSAAAAAMRRLQAALFGVTVEIPVVFDRQKIAEALADEFEGKVRPAEDAGLSVSFGADGAVEVSVVPESDGLAVDEDATISRVEARLKDMVSDPVEVVFVRESPKLKKEAVEPLAGGVGETLERAPLRISAKNLSWTISKGLLADWLDAVSDGNGGARIGLDAGKVAKFLESRAESLRREPKDAVFEETGGRVTKFEPSEDGEEVDPEGSVLAIEQALAGTGEVPGAVELPFRAVPPKTDTASSNRYGIKDIIGIGESNFKGSPTNRRKNIATGAGHLDGTLVAPNEEFSLLKALGEINGERGYLKELVIKKDKTVPEYGGGLCQIGTTTFRGALDAGLPITARQNHSYRVIYYERDGAGSYMGPGKDATIYDPWPDFKFLNDTGSPILIKTAIKGDRLTFTFWGVRDGRKAEQTEARVWNVVPPPEKKVVETTDLKPGETKCVESPHSGADASFNYIVTYADGEVKEQTFTSHYRPWGEICLLGIDPNATPAGDEGATGAPIPPTEDTGG